MTESKTIYTVRVGYADTDQGGVVHHSVYLRWLEQARIEYLRERGIDFRRLEKEQQLTLVVVDLHARYRSPARFDDLVDVHVWPARATSVSVLFGYAIHRGDTLLVEAEVKLACVHLGAGTVHRLPDPVAAALA
ncbi:MAG: acyl-CoA thioesterase [Myxococcales bacterium]|nr:acyl-CoA thioesterase [Myxococcales bacterium]